MNSKLAIVDHQPRKEFAFVAELLTDIGRTARPSDEILNCGLRFDHFQAPFSVYGPIGGPREGFISVADALDYAIREYRRTGKAQWVGDAIDELVYEISG